MSDKLCSKVAIYDRKGDARQIYLYWVEKTDKAVSVEKGVARTILMKKKATVLEALQELGYDEKMTLELYAPHHHPLKELLEMPLSNAPPNRVVLVPHGIEVSGNPFAGM
jgi:hypothetical protein